MTYERELSEAVAAAEIAGRYVLAEYASFVPIPDAPASISTHVDRESQEIILRHLRAEFPADGLVAEERTPTLETAAHGGDRVWIVDPIDGTRGFAIKNDEFSVMIGLAVGGRPVLGVVLEPTLARITYAAKGMGCWVRVGDGEPTQSRVTDIADIERAVLVQSRSKAGRPPKPVVVALWPRSVVETYSAGIKLAMVARGDADLYVNDYTGIHDWDVCAGHALVEEAGGRVSGFDGRPVVYGDPESRQRQGMIASNGHLHGETTRRLSSV